MKTIVRSLVIAGVSGFALSRLVPGIDPTLSALVLFGGLICISLGGIVALATNTDQ